MENEPGFSKQPPTKIPNFSSTYFEMVLPFQLSSFFVFLTNLFIFYNKNHNKNTCFSEIPMCPMWVQPVLLSCLYSRWLTCSDLWAHTGRMSGLDLIFTLGFGVRKYNLPTACSPRGRLQRDTICFPFFCNFRGVDVFVDK